MLECINARAVPVAPGDAKRIAPHGAHFYGVHIVWDLFGENSAFARDLIHTKRAAAVDAKKVDWIDALVPIAPGDAHLRVAQLFELHGRDIFHFHCNFKSVGISLAMFLMLICAAKFSATFIKA